MIKFSSLMLAVILVLSSNLAFAGQKSSKVKEVNHGEIDKIKCDKTVSDTLHLGDSFKFYVDFSAEDMKAQITDVNYWFWSDEDYNGSEDIIAFTPTKEIIDADWIVDNKTIKLVRSNEYNVKSLPQHPSDENIILKYEIIFRRFLSENKPSNKDEHYVICARYGIKK